MCYQHGALFPTEWDGDTAVCNRFFAPSGKLEKRSDDQVAGALARTPASDFRSEAPRTVTIRVVIAHDPHKPTFDKIAHVTNPCRSGSDTRLSIITCSVTYQRYQFYHSMMCDKTRSVPSHLRTTMPLSQITL